MTVDLTKEELKPDHPDRETGFERILTDPMPPWFVELYPGADGKGFLQKLNRHAISYHERSLKRLVISFDNIAVVNDLSFSREPWGWRFFRDQGWSHLGIFCRSKAWFRDEEIIDCIRGKSKAGFFDQFDQVVLTGSSMGAFGALIFAPLVPRATVVAFNPQSTLDERLVPWETRYRFGRAQNWDLPLGDGAAAVKKAQKIYVFYDPFFDLDRRHALRLEGKKTVLLKTWCSNHFAAPMLRKMGLLKDVMLTSMDGSLQADAFYKMMRARRTLPLYMRGLEDTAGEAHPKLIVAARDRFRTLRRAALAEEARTHQVDDGLDEP